MTVGELLSRVTSAELTEWQAFFKLESEDTERQRMQSQSVAGAKTRRYR